MSRKFAKELGLQKRDLIDLVQKQKMAAQMRELKIIRDLHDHNLGGHGPSESSHTSITTISDKKMSLQSKMESMRPTPGIRKKSVNSTSNTEGKRKGITFIKLQTRTQDQLNKPASLKFTEASGDQPALAKMRSRIFEARKKTICLEASEEPTFDQVT